MQAFRWVAIASGVAVVLAGKRLLSVKLIRLDSAEEVELTRFPVTLGRGGAADIRIADPTVSRMHCALKLIGGVLVAVDLGSSNGTWVNGWPLAERPLLPADLLSIGEVTFRVQEDPT